MSKEKTAPTIFENGVLFITSNQELTIIALLAITTLASFYFAKSNSTSIRNLCLGATNSLWSLVLHLSGVVWASSVSIYNDELQRQIISRTDNLDSIGSIFLAANVTAVILLTMRNRGEKIKAEIEKSLPPTEVIRFSAEKYKEHLKLFESTATSEYRLGFEFIKDADKFRKRQEIAISTIASNTKLVVSGIVEIANSWTKQRHGELKYSANIFSIIDKDGYDIEAETILNQAILKSPFFLYTDSLESRLDFCDKLIISQQEFSSCNQAQDKQGKPLVLPYTDLSDRPKKYHPNFEGAPAAIETRQAQYIPDTKKVASVFFERLSASNHADHVTQHYKNCITQYYKKDNTRSLLSIPMNGDDGNVFAILNIYSETRDMLSSKERAIAFYQFIRPHIAVLEYMINTQIKIAKLLPPTRNFCEEIIVEATAVTYNLHIQPMFED
ncbi:hypothetical protein [Vibrio parahaemolyticus]|uniref:hypothetical protein n=2 Tax=Vibrio parahaemolyticus TaxID=670 RepID=UPI0005F1BEC2|nr:hypothetical protein [Vibrio parahaemolyticus]EHK4786440.1 hypothetical protein [Vibrio parahaemolyticus]EIJ0976069.1 hypothetical protein [Vibrio parahaemolyticus]EKA6057121.1 hypothetical protein [Vibrio parahaemolyticus]MBE5136849.1 hypothetical protein [Vibrio parahaemolyticus]MBM4991910.1 hypothetical protein [Vibrio parahaemolyticus]